MRKQSQLCVRKAGQVSVLVVQQRCRADHIRRHNVRKQFLDCLLIALCGQRDLDRQGVDRAVHLELIPVRAAQRCKLLTQTPHRKRQLRVDPGQHLKPALVERVGVLRHNAEDLLVPLNGVLPCRAEKLRIKHRISGIMQTVNLRLLGLT